MPKYAFTDAVPLPTSNRDTLSKFELDKMAVGNSFLIPMAKRRDGKMAPADGFNVKAANARFAKQGFEFSKKKTPDGLRVYRVK